MYKPWACSICKKKFHHPMGVQHHQRDYHKRPGEAVRVKKKPPKEEEADISYADLAIEAEKNKAAGLPYEAWLLGE